MIFLSFQDIYKKELEKYRNSLSESQILAIKLEKNKTKEEKVARAEQKERREEATKLGKPKASSSAFLLFFTELSKKGKTNVYDAKSKWDELSDSQKGVYSQRATESREAYE